MFYCEHCGKPFAHYAGLGNHLKLKHSSRSPRSESMEDEENDTMKEEEEEKEDDEQTESESEDEEKKDAETRMTWKKIILSAAEDLKETYNLTNEELLKEENLVPRTITTIFDDVSNRIKEVKLLKGTDLYKTVKEEENRLVDEQDYPRWEARLKALENRKYYIKDNLEAVLLPESDEEEM